MFGIILVLKHFYSCSFSKYSLSTYWMVGRGLETSDKAANRIVQNKKAERHFKKAGCTIQTLSTEGFLGEGRQGNAQCLGHSALGQIEADFNFSKGLNFNLKLKKYFINF